MYIYNLILETKQDLLCRLISGLQSTLNMLSEWPPCNHATWSQYFWFCGPGSTDINPITAVNQQTLAPSANTAMKWPLQWLLHSVVSNRIFKDNFSLIQSRMMYVKRPVQWKGKQMGSHHKPMPDNWRRHSHRWPVDMHTILAADRWLFPVDVSNNCTHPTTAPSNNCTLMASQGIHRLPGYEPERLKDKLPKPPSNPS